MKDIIVNHPTTPISDAARFFNKRATKKSLSNKSKPKSKKFDYPSFSKNRFNSSQDDR